MLSAAHCLLENEEWEVIAGAHNFALPSGTEQVRHVAQAILHEDYSVETLFYDIAVLRLASPLVLVPGVVTLTHLPNAGVLHTGMVTLHGWGSISRTQERINPDILQVC